MHVYSRKGEGKKGATNTIQWMDRPEPRPGNAAKGGLWTDAIEPAKG